ncbi:MAG: ABA4-like family protein [Candidatus Poseidoniaceae archaeon]
MEIEIVMFWISSIYIVPIWGLMWFAPRHEITKKIVGDLRISVLPLLIPYAILAIPTIPDIFATLGTEMPTPDLIIEFFQDDKVIILGWLHFLAFDVLAGRFIWQRMLACDRPMYVSTPILVLGMMVAPLGFLIGLIATWEYSEINIDA